MKRMAMVVGFALMLALPAAARAQGRTDFTRMPIAPFYVEFDAGDVCEFPYAVESLGGTVIRIRFYDADGTKIRAILIGDETIRHWNLATGAAIVEEIHGTTQRDFVTGEETWTGLFWHDRSADGKLVLAGAGRYVLDMSTEALLDSTPNVNPDPGLCAVLATAPAGP